MVGVCSGGGGGGGGGGGFGLTLDVSGGWNDYVSKCTPRYLNTHLVEVRQAHKGLEERPEKERRAAKFQEEGCVARELHEAHEKSISGANLLYQRG